MTWTTLVEPKYAAYGVGEVHNVWFLPKGWPGKGTVINLLIPECELHFCFAPARNRSARRLCQPANQEQKHQGLAPNSLRNGGRAQSVRLPNHERTALERMYEASSRSRSNLS